MAYKKKIGICILIALTLLAAFRIYSRRLSDNIGAVPVYAVGAVSTNTQGRNSTVLFFDENLDLIDKKEMNIGSLSSEYSVPFRNEERVYIPTTGEVKNDDIIMVDIETKSGDVKYYKDPKEIGVIDTLFQSGDKMYYTSNINSGCSLREMNFNGGEEKSADIMNTLIGNGGRLGEELFLIAHSTPADGGPAKDGTTIVFYNDNLEKQREFYTDKFVHRGPSIVHNDKVYFMSSNAEEEDKRIFSVDSQGNFEEIPLNCWVYRIESTPEGLLAAGGDEKSGSFILIKKDGEQIHYGMKEESLLQMKWQGEFLYTLDRVEEGDKSILRKYELEKNEMKLVQEKEIEFNAPKEIIRSIF